MRIGTVIIVFMFFAIRVNSQDYIFRNFTSEEGLTQPYVYSIVQDSRGYLWLGTGDGLARYNGFKFRQYNTDDSLAFNFITCSFIDGENLWFGHSNGMVSFYDGRIFHKIDLADRKISPVTHIGKSPGGSILISTLADGIFRSDKPIIADESKSDIENQNIYCFDFVNENGLLIGTGSGLKYCILNNNGSIDSVRPVDEIPDSKINAIRRKQDGKGFYIATENDGIFILSLNNNIFKVSKILTDSQSDFSGIQYILEDSRMNLWLCSFGNGLIKLVRGTSGEYKSTVYNTSTGFSTDNVKTVYEDREGCIWSGNYGDGLTQITPKPFSVSVFDKRSASNGVFAIWSDNQYRWIGTENGLIKTDQYTGKVIKTYRQGSGLPKDTVSALYSADGKELWIGTDKNGLFRMQIENEKITKYSLASGALENSVTAITGKDDQVWIGTKKGLCNISISADIAKWYSISQGGLPQNLIKGIFLDRLGILWITTNSGTLTTIENGKVSKTTVNTGAGILILGPVAEDNESRVWIGSNGNGVFIVEADSIFNITTKEGLLSDYCYSLIRDDRNNIWVGHKGGLSRINTTDLTVKPFRYFDNISENFQFNPNAVNISTDSKIWFGSDKGLVSYNPLMELQQIEAPLLGTTSVKVDDEEIYPTGNKIILPPGNHKIRIDFLGVSLKNPELVTYQYMLEGYNQWSEITKIPSITYDRIPEGDYRFILKSSSGDGAVSENPVIINITIKKPLWKKWWFYALSFVLINIVIFIYIKRREIIFLEEKRKLEKKVTERTYEISCQKNEIELQRDVIENKNASITSSITCASNIQNAILPPRELMDKLLPDNFILSKPKDIVSGDFYWMTEKDKKIIFAVADCTGHGVPGAFMSLLGITLLNEIVNIHGITRSDEIITALREKVIQSMQQNRKDVTTTDGMEIALCVLDRHNNKLQYTGGMSDLIYISGGKLQIIKADFMDVSISYNFRSQFKMNELDCKKGDVLYLFSDGYQDQFGGNYDKKFLRTHFYTILLEIHSLPMKRQKEILEKKLNDWMKNPLQTDDITVMGVRL